MGKRRFVQKDKSRDSKSQSVSSFLPIFLLSSAAALTILAYIRSLYGPLVFDDPYIIESHRLKQLWDTLNFTTGRIVANFSFALNYRISGMTIFWFKATNLALHLITGMAAFFFTYITLNTPLVREKFGKSSKIISTVVAVLFLLHPIQTGTVNYVTQRMAIMAALFSFLCVILYAKAFLKTGWKACAYYILSGVSFVLAIFSKETAVMVLLVLPLYDLMFLSSFQWREFRKRFISQFVLLTALALIVAFRMHAVKNIKEIITVFLNPYQPMGKHWWSGIGINWTPIEFFLTELRIVCRYIFLILFPNPSLLVFDYSGTYPVSGGLFNPVSTFFSLLFLVSLLLFSLKYMKRFPLISFGILWYLITISLESFIAVGIDPYFEHRNYLPSLGLFLALASLLVYLDRPGLKIRKKAVIIVLGLLLFVLTYSRNGVWTSEYLFWKDILNKSPHNPRAQVALSSIYIEEGKYTEAEELLEKVNKLDVPIDNEFKFSMSINQATVYRMTNRTEEALDILKRIVSEKFLMDYQRGKAYLIMGEIFRNKGMPYEAEKYLKKAYEIDQTNPYVLISLGFVSQSLGEMNEAEGYFKSSIDIDPKQPIPYVELGNIYFIKGDTDKAEKCYREAISIRSDMPKNLRKNVFLSLAQIMLAKGNIDESAVLFTRLTEIDPMNYLPYIFLGDVYLRRGNPDKALYYFEKALSFKGNFIKEDPNAKLLYFYIGMVYDKKGDKNLSEKNLKLFLSKAGSDRRFEGQIKKAKEKLGLLKNRSAILMNNTSATLTGG
jgi:tetratricopeptide (TPR) repeat protein